MPLPQWMTSSQPMLDEIDRDHQLAEEDRPLLEDLVALLRHTEVVRIDEEVLRHTVDDQGMTEVLHADDEMTTDCYNISTKANGSLSLPLGIGTIPARYVIDCLY